MDTAFIREVMNEQVRLNVALCHASYKTENLVKEKDAELTLARKERDDARRECEEWKQKYEELRVNQTDGVLFVNEELKKIREDVEQHGAIPYDIINEEKEEVNEEEKKNVVIDDKKEKRREYMKEYMKKKRDAKKSNEDTE
jgi:hypothetical protein